MIKKAISALALLCSVAYASATVNYMIVEQKDGEKFSFLLSENPQITYSDGDLVVNGNSSTTYAISDVKNYHFAEKYMDGVENFSADVLSITTLDDATVKVQNAPANVKVLLINANAALQSTGTTDAYGTATVNLPSQKGIYILMVGNKSFKIIRK